MAGVNYDIVDALRDQSWSALGPNRAVMLEAADQLEKLIAERDNTWHGTRP